MVFKDLNSMGSFNEALFEQKLLYLKDTHESIANLSSWCLSNQEHHGKIVSTWLSVLKRVKTEHRLLLFYLANDVIQYSKRKSLPFADSFAPALQKATTMVREDSVRNKILRLFKIWNERGIYDEGFLVDLSGLLSRVHKNTTRIDVQEFQPSVMYSRIRSCKELEDDTDVKLNTLNESHISFTDIEKLRNSLKDREHGDELLVDFDAGLASVKAYIKALEAEIKERHGLIDLLEIGEQYYEREFQEAKVVVNAYKCFGTRVRGVKRKLEEQIEIMPSPLPSPDVNAPSPSPEPKDGISTTVKCFADYKPNNYFPPHQVKKECDTVLVSPYSPDSNLDAKPVDSAQNPYLDETDEPKVYKPPKIKKQYVGDITENESTKSNSSTPSYGLTDIFTSEAFHHGHSFLQSTTAKDFQNINISQDDIKSETKIVAEASYGQINSEPQYGQFKVEYQYISPRSNGGKSELQYASSLSNGIKDDFQYTTPNANSIKTELQYIPPNSNGSSESKGNNIEVITSSEQQLTLSALLQTLIPSDTTTQNSISKCQTLDDIPNPPKFSGWSDEPEHVWETPESPPLYEKANYPTVFDEQVLTQDVDMRFTDVDHRNLINLTENASTTWALDDTDYRTKENLKKNNLPSIPNQDNVENVDMEMSDEEEKHTENLKSDVTDLLHTPTTRTTNILNIPLQNPPPTPDYSYDNCSKEESYFNTSSENSDVKPVVSPETVPALTFNTSTTNYSPPYTNNTTYTTHSCTYNKTSSASTYTVCASSTNNSSTNTIDNDNISSLKTCYTDVYISPPPLAVKVDVNNISDFNLDKFPSPPPPLPPPLPPPPPPPPHPPRLWSQSFSIPPPPPQFDTAQQSLFFSRPPPPVPPSPQISIANRPYRANFRPFQRVNARFQRW